MNGNTYSFIFYLVLFTCNNHSRAVEDLVEELQVPEEISVVDILIKKQVDAHNCSENEEFVTCKSCEKTCDGQNTTCLEPCGNGCFCKFFRDKNGKCVKYENCTHFREESANGVIISPFSNLNPISNITLKASPQVSISCGLHQQFSSCTACKKTCSDPNPSCVEPCSSGCVCVDGYVLAPDGDCVELHNCPKEEFLGKEVFFGHEVSIEECAPDEVFVQCGWCEGSCSAPSPFCAPACTRGCVCRPPLLRHHSGHCVLEEDCKAQKCPSINEEYVCKYGCEASCETGACPRRRRCRLGCHCKLGLLRDKDGKCVKEEQCSNYVTVINNK